MSKRNTVRRIRCASCGELAATTVLGRCPRCTSVEYALASAWQLETSLTRTLVRPDGARLGLYVRREGDHWSVHIIETRVDGGQSVAQLSAALALPAALGEADTFARRWLERQPGTTIATFVAKPAPPAS